MTLPRKIPHHLQEAFIAKAVKQAKAAIPTPTRRASSLVPVSSLSSRKRKFAAGQTHRGGGSIDDGTGVALLWQWIGQHLTRPYPTKSEKVELLKKTGLTKVQLRNFFTNVRKRHFRPILQRGRKPRSELELAILEANKTISAGNQRILKPAPSGARVQAKLTTHTCAEKQSTFSSDATFGGAAPVFDGGNDVDMIMVSGTEVSV